MPDEDFRRALPDATAIVSGGWRYGDVLGQAASIRAILTVSGGWPPELDYPECFRRGIRVLLAAPAFAGAVAEMAIALALACSRDVATGDRAMRAGNASGSTQGASATSRSPASASGSSGTATSAVGCTSSCDPSGARSPSTIPWLTDAYLLSQEVAPASLEDMLRSRMASSSCSPRRAARTAPCSLARDSTASAGLRARARQPRARRRLRRPHRVRPGGPFEGGHRRVPNRAASSQSIRSGRRPAQSCPRTGRGRSRRRCSTSGRVSWTTSRRSSAASRPAGCRSRSLSSRPDMSERPRSWCRGVHHRDRSGSPPQ